MVSDVSSGKRWNLLCFFLYICFLISILPKVTAASQGKLSDIEIEQFDDSSMQSPQRITLDNLDEFLDKLKYADGWTKGEMLDYKMEKKQKEKLQLIEKINDIPPQDLSKMLKSLGFTDVQLGEHQTREIGERTKKKQGQFCETTTHYHTSIPPDSADVFLEEDSALEVRSTTGDPVACACDEFDCTCRKQCFCKVQSEPLKTTPTPTCKKCVNCDGTPFKDDEEPEEKEPERPAPAPFEFKCSCSFDGSGGDEEPNKSAMDCDCKVSDCKCTRKCKCRTADT